VKRYYRLKVDMGYIIHVGLVGGRVERCLYWCHFPMVAPICSSVQLPFIYLNLSATLVPSGRFSCRSQVSYLRLLLDY